MGRLLDIFGGRSATAFAARARLQLAGGGLANAEHLVEQGLKRHPGAESLLEIRLLIRRSQARPSIAALRQRLPRDPHAWEEIIALHRSLEMSEDVHRLAQEYLRAHPDRDSAHLIVGEIALERFFEHLRARDGHAAHEHLQRAAALNAAALKPRLLLAELYFCVDARRSLARVCEALSGLGRDVDEVQRVLAATAPVADASAPEQGSGLFERIEVAGRLPRDASAWPLRTPRNARGQMEEDRAQAACARLVEREAVDEAALLRADGTLLAYGRKDRSGASNEAAESSPPSPSPESRSTEPALVQVVRAVARTVAEQAADLDLGAFRRCALEGAFGIVVTGRVGEAIAGVHSRRAREPLRLWERVLAAVEATQPGRSAPS